MNRVIAVAVGAVVLTILTSGFNPYITNTIDHCNPIYPLGIGDKDTEYLNDGAQPLFCKRRTVLYKYYIAILLVLVISLMENTFHHIL